MRKIDKLLHETEKIKARKERRTIIVECHENNYIYDCQGTVKKFKNKQDLMNFLTQLNYNVIIDDIDDNVPVSYSVKKSSQGLEKEEKQAISLTYEEKHHIRKKEEEKTALKYANPKIEELFK